MAETPAQEQWQSGVLGMVDPRLDELYVENALKVGLSPRLKKKAAAANAAIAKT
jgi:hypothetical protein